MVAQYADDVMEYVDQARTENKKIDTAAKNSPGLKFIANARHVLGPVGAIAGIGIGLGTELFKETKDQSSKKFEWAVRRLDAFCEQRIRANFESPAATR